MEIPNGQAQPKIIGKITVAMLDSGQVIFEANVGNAVQAFGMLEVAKVQLAMKMATKQTIVPPTPEEGALDLRS